MGLITYLRAAIARLLGLGLGDPSKDGPAPIAQGLEGYTSFGDWNPWSRYNNPISAFFDFYQQNPWVRGVCDKIAGEILNDGWQLVDETAAQRTHPDFESVSAWLTAINFGQLRHCVGLDLAVCRNAYLYKQRNGLGQITNLLRIPPQTMKPLGTTATGVTAWKQTVGNLQRVYALEDILHIKGPNPLSDIVGLPVLTASAIDVEADNAMALFNRSYFGNGTQAGMVLKLNESKGSADKWTDSDERRALNRWTQMISYIERRYQNPTNSHLPLVLRGDWDLLKGAGQAVADAQFLDGRRFNARTVCTSYGFPMEALGLGDRGALGGNLADPAQEQLDAVVDYHESLFDSHFTLLFLQGDLGIVGLKTTPRPRASRITTAATVAAKNMATTGCYTRAEIRAVTMHARPAIGADEFVLVTPTGVQPQEDVQLPDSTLAQALVDTGAARNGQKVNGYRI